MYHYSKICDDLKEKVLVIAIEEFCELNQQLTKCLRGKMHKERLLEEYADCLIVMEWIKEYCNLSDEEVSNWLDKKNRRNAKRIQEGVFR
ncbi:MAG TPA: hypothetical protein IAB35_01535 [Candidatus Faecimonas gallistercoris]|nr:hypothetical protein [Candidatus Faecimonas gallistercoris]